ncbi:MAG: T9SS type A sorting domain-containing protein [Crocinitomicaceae bacterium]
MRGLFFFILLTISFSLFSQIEKKYSTINTPDWIQEMYRETPNPGLVIELHDAYYATHEFVKSEHTQYYKRWLRTFSRPTVFDLNDETVQNYVTASKALSAEKDFNSTWSGIGPFDFDKEAASHSYAPGAAHVYTVERSMSNPAILFAGTATAGLWKSINSGASWTSVTKNMMVNSIFAIEIDPTNANIAYFGSGGKLYKTTNGGTSWSVMGDPAFQSNNHEFQDIVISPVNANLLFLNTDYGFYRSTDGGNNFSQIMSGEFQEIEINPANANLIYTIKVVNFRTQFWRSTDNGLTFVQQTNGWPNPLGASDEQARTEIAVTPANPAIIYANATGKANGGSGTYGIYKSTDTGLTWTFMCCGTQPAGPPSPTNINMMGWDKQGQDDGGQYYYDVALAVDPLNADMIHLGGVNHWVSTDGGVNWTCPTKWSEPGLPGYVHADIHDIRYLNGELWFACDGGVFKSTDNGNTVNRSMLGIEGSDFWGFGVSPQSDVMLGGAYHNGTLLKDNNVYDNGWICTGGGDGVRGFVNFGNDRMAYDDYEGRNLPGNRLTAIQGFQFDSLPNASYIFGESSDMAWDPRNYNHIYLGRGKNLLKTENNGQTYSIVHTFAHKVCAVELAPSNLNVIYVTTYQDWWGLKKVWRTTDAGVTWTEITPPTSLLGGDEWVPYDIAVSATNADEIWLARTSQYSSYPNLDNKNVYKSTNGGNSWLLYTSPNLNGEWITNIVHQAGTDGGVYIGTRRAVYYRNNSMTSWALFNNALPLSTPSTKLVAKYNTQQLLNATSRSVYTVDFYEPSLPIAQISADKFKLNCLDNLVHFVDHSVLSNHNPQWQWTFSGGTPSTSTLQNPVVSFAAPGFHAVSLTVTDDYGTSSQSYSQFIEVTAPNSNPNLVEDFENGISSEWTQRNANNSFSWSEKIIANGPNCTSTSVAWVNHYDINAVGDEAELISPAFDLTNVSAAELTYDYAYAQYGDGYQDGLRIDISTDCFATYDTLFLAYGNNLETVPDQSNFWEPANCNEWSLGNAIDIGQYTGQEVMIRFVGINAFGNNFYLDNVNVSTNLGLKEFSELSFQIYPNPSNGKLFINHNLHTPLVKIYSLDGKVVYEETISKTAAQIDLKLSAGTYLVELTENGQRGMERVVIR